MVGPISDDGRDSENSKYAPRRFREQPRMPTGPQLYVSSLPAVPSSTDIDRDGPTKSELTSWPEATLEPPPRRWGTRRSR